MVTLSEEEGVPLVLVCEAGKMGQALEKGSVFSLLLWAVEV